MSKNKPQKPYFAGWYFKHQLGNQIIAFIPGVNKGANGKLQGFIQVISNYDSYFVKYPFHQCDYNRKKNIIKIGPNVFTSKGIKINIHKSEICISGKVKYGPLDKIKYSIMGYYKYFPFMECKHEVISMNHSLKGYINLLGKRFDLTEGRGYIEKDWGHSFPMEYLWLQCNQFNIDNCSIMLSIAKIPYVGFSFWGCICVIHFKGQEYRFTTYLGVKIKSATKEMIILRQKENRLIILLEENKRVNSELNREERYEDKLQIVEKRQRFGHTLKAPVLGQMKRSIREEHLCEGRFILMCRHKKVFDLRSEYVSFEYVEED